MFGNNQRRQVTYGVVLLLSAFLAFSPLRIVSLFAVIYVASRLLHRVPGLISRLILSFLILVCVNASVAAVAWTFGWPLASGIMLAGYSLCLLAISIFSTVPTLVPTKKEAFDRGDLWSLGLAVLVMGVLIVPVMHTFRPEGLLPIIANGGDNSAHIEMVKFNDLNHGFSLGLNNRINPARNQISYPQGWHFNQAFLKWTVETAVPFHNSPSRLVIFYYITTALWFCAFIFLLLRTVYAITEKLRPQQSELAKLAPLFVVATATAGWLLPLLLNGFQSEIGAFCLILGELYFLLVAFDKKPSTRYGYLMLAALMVAGINYFWVFLTPVAAIPVAVCLVYTAWVNRRLPPLHIWFVAFFVGLSALFQIYIQLTYTSPVNNPSINARGFIQPTAMYVLLALFLMASVYVYIRSANIRLRLAYLFSVIALLFSLGLMRYQLQTIHELRYYYFKSTYTFIMLVVIILAVASYELLGNALRIKPPYKKIPVLGHKLLLSLAFVLFASLGFWSLKSVSFDKLTRGGLLGFSHSQAAKLSEALNVNTTEGYHIIPIGSCNRGDDIRVLLFSHALAYAPQSSVGTVASVELEPISRTGLFTAINRFLDVSREPITVLSSDQQIGNQLMDALGDNRQYVKLVNLDGSPETEPFTQCPERIHD